MLKSFLGRVLVFMSFTMVLPAQASEEEAPVKAVFKVDKHLLAAQVDFGKDGRCKASRGRTLKAWRVPGFPATIPHFESCTTVSSPQGGTVEFRIVVKNPAGEEVTSVNGVLELGEEGSKGSASQAINWDDLEIPKAGKYHMVIEVEGEELARYPLRFSRSRKKRSSKRK
ncbi:MAG: hypothetical protein JRF33_17460 [Deltaproteobacteria bacterium]|nr:hypothetical protein [Deltaproteobacteria bacterium]